MFANGPGDLGLIPGRVLPKTQKMLNTQHYKENECGEKAPQLKLYLPRQFKENECGEKAPQLKLWEKITVSFIVHFYVLFSLIFV